MTHKKTTYSDAGVNIDAGNTLVNEIKPLIQKTRRPEVIGSLGGFGALFELPLNRYQNPILVSSTDGVGTKLKLAFALNQHHTIGIDLVAMCVNDIIVTGAEPLFFLDYYATGKLSVDTAKEVISGIADGCALAGAALVGGETAEMPGMYPNNEYDLAGFSVGIVEKSRLLGPSRVQNGDILIGIASSGLHSNGFSLARNIIETQQIDLHMPFESTTLAQTLLTPTKIYVKSLLPLIAQEKIHALAHITGGGLLENLPRVFDSALKAEIDTSSWEWPALFTFLQKEGPIDTKEMYRTFNCGVGMVAIAHPEAVDCCLEHLNKAGETAWVLGHISARADAEASVVIK